MTELYCYPIPFDHYDKNIALLNQGLNKWKLTSNSDHIQEQYVTEFINHKVMNEKSKCPFLEISESIFECEGMGLELRQVRIFPTIQEFTNLPSIEYEKYITHQTKLFKSYHSGSASGMKEIPAFKSRRRYLNFGKRVKYLSWCPKLSSEDQVLVGVATIDEVDQKFELDINPPKNYDLIQVWECGNMWERNDGPRLAYSFVHNWGHIVDATWISADEINMDIVHNSPYIKGKRQALHGHMLFCCTDGFARLVPIPKFSEMELCQWLQNVPESCESPILIMDPSIQMKLGLGCLFIEDDRSMFGYPTCVDWKSKFIDKVVIGFSKGFVGVYDLSVVHHMRYDSIHHYLTPIFKRRVSFASILSVCFSSFEWKTFNVSVTANSYPQTNFIMKMTSKSPPSDVLKLSQPPKYVLWTYSSDIFVCVPCDSDSIKISSLLCQSVTTIPISKINCIAYCESLNTILIGTQSGSVMTLTLNHRSIMQSILDIGTSHDLHDLAKSIRHYRSVSKNTKGNHIQMLVDCETQADVLQLYDDVPFVSYPNINQIAVNPNVTAAGFAAIVFDSGIVHLMHFCDQELSELMRDISIFSLQSEEQNMTVSPPKLPAKDKKFGQMGGGFSVATNSNMLKRGRKPRSSMTTTILEPPPSTTRFIPNMPYRSIHHDDDYDDDETDEHIQESHHETVHVNRHKQVMRGHTTMPTNNITTSGSKRKMNLSRNYMEVDEMEQFDKMMEADRIEREREAAAALYPLQHLETGSSVGNNDSFSRSRELSRIDNPRVIPTPMYRDYNNPRPGQQTSKKFSQQMYFEDDYQMDYLFDQNNSRVPNQKPASVKRLYRLPGSTTASASSSSKQSNIHHEETVTTEIVESYSSRSNNCEYEVVSMEEDSHYIEPSQHYYQSQQNSTQSNKDTTQTTLNPSNAFNKKQSDNNPRSVCPVRVIKTVRKDENNSMLVKAPPVKVISKSAGGTTIKIVPVKSGRPANVKHPIISSVPIKQEDKKIKSVESKKTILIGADDENDDNDDEENGRLKIVTTPPVTSTISSNTPISSKINASQSISNIHRIRNPWWYNRLILIEWHNDNDRMLHGRQEVNGRLVVDEPIVNKVVRVHWPDINSLLVKAIVIDSY